MPFSPRNNPILQRQLIRLGIVLLIAVIAWIARSREPQQANRPLDIQRDRVTLPAERPNSERPTEPENDTPADSSLVIRNLALRDEDGATIYRGDINLQPTLVRIAEDRKLRFSHDGTVFENRERR